MVDDKLLSCSMAWKLISARRKIISSFAHLGLCNKRAQGGSTSEKTVYKGFVLFVLLLYVPSQQLWSLRNRQFT